MNEFCLQECQDHARTLTLTLDCPTPPLPPPPGSLPPVACYTHHFFVCLLVCFLLFSNQWQKNPLFNAKHPFSFRSKMPEKTGSALDPAGSTRRSLLFDRDLLFIFGFVVLVAEAVASLLTFRSHSPLNHRFDQKINCPYSHGILWRLLECNAAPTEVGGNTVNFVLVAKLQIKTTFIASSLVRLGQW